MPHDTRDYVTEQALSYRDFLYSLTPAPLHKPSGFGPQETARTRANLLRDKLELQAQVWPAATACSSFFKIAPWAML